MKVLLDVQSYKRKDDISKICFDAVKELFPEISDLEFKSSIIYDLRDITRMGLTRKGNLSVPVGEYVFENIDFLKGRALDINKNIEIRKVAISAIGQLSLFLGGKKKQKTIKFFERLLKDKTLASEYETIKNKILLLEVKS